MVPYRFSGTDFRRRFLVSVSWDSVTSSLLFISLFDDVSHFYVDFSPVICTVERHRLAGDGPVRSVPCRFGCCWDATTSSITARTAAWAAAAVGHLPATGAVAARQRSTAGVDRAQTTAEKSGQEPDQRPQRASPRCHRYGMDACRTFSIWTYFPRTFPARKISLPI